MGSSMVWASRTGFLPILGQDCAVTKPPDLLRNVQADKVIADKAYDSGVLLTQIKDQGDMAVILPQANRTEPRAYDRKDHKKRTWLSVPATS